MAHNLAYYALSAVKFGKEIIGKDTTKIEGLMDAANPANIGGTVFNNIKEDSNNIIAYSMIGFNILTAPISTIVDYITYRRNK